jgi:hypothetical protein
MGPASRLLTAALGQRLTGGSGRQDIGPCRVGRLECNPAPGRAS